MRRTSMCLKLSFSTSKRIAAVAECLILPPQTIYAMWVISIPGNKEMSTSFIYHNLLRLTAQDEYQRWRRGGWCPCRSREGKGIPLRPVLPWPGGCASKKRKEKQANAMVLTGAGYQEQSMALLVFQHPTLSHEPNTLVLSAVNIGGICWAETMDFNMYSLY